MAYDLDQIVREYMIEKGDQTEHSYPRLLSFAIRGLRELSLDVSGVPKIVVLNMKDDLTIDLPPDYIRYVKIGVCDSNGNIRSLALNNELCLPRSTDNCGNHKTELSKGQNFSSLNVLTSGLLTSASFSEGTSSHFRNGEFTGRMFGLGGGSSAATYRVDNERNTIQFGSTAGGNIVLEYLSDFTMADASYVVHPFIIETLLAFIAWKDLARKKASSKQDAELARRDYFLAKHNSERRYSSINIDEAYQALRQGFKLSPKL